MKKRFKKVYVEITNICNLSCSFCLKSNRRAEEMSTTNFEKVLMEINSYTDYIYLHVKGEPLLHSKLKEILLLCKKYNKKVNITTNATLLKKKSNILLESGVVRQINLSLHSENNKENYLEEIFEVSSKLTSSMSVVYRFWTLNKGQLRKETTEIMDKIIKYYELSTEIVEKLKTDVNCRIGENIYINKAEEFSWPSLDNEYSNSFGYCHAVKDHIAVLVDGTVVPCCLDGEGVISLGNIFTTSLKDILEENRVLNMKKGFENRKVTEKLCKHCSFKEKFSKKLEHKTNV